MRQWLAPRLRQELVIPISFGDIYDALDALRWATKRRDLSLFARQLWVIREHHRRSTWQPFTLGQYVVLLRERVWWATEPHLRGPYPEWRHSRHAARPSRKEKP